MRPFIGFTLIAAMLALRCPTARAQTGGTIAAWGRNTTGQCEVPPPNSDFVAAAAGAYHSIGLTGGGVLIAWGNNDFGQCDVPQPDSGFIAIAAGHEHNLGLSRDGSIAAWGYNYYGGCTIPEPNADFVAIACGSIHSLAIKVDGSVVAWGHNHDGQCDVPAPNTAFVAIQGGYRFSAGLKSDGSIVAWGSNSDGQCDVPVPNSGFVAIAAGDAHCLGLKADGSIVAWGANESSQCQIPSPNSDFIAVAAGSAHSLGLRSDGSIVAWGRNDFQQCGVPVPNSHFIAVAAGDNHSLGLKLWTGACCRPDGTCWLSTVDVCDGVWQGEGPGCEPNPCVPFAWSNAGGALVIHDTGLTYTSELSVPPQSPAPTCGGVDNQILLETRAVWKVYAVFPASGHPRLRGLLWSVYPSTNGGGGIVVEGWGLPDPSADTEYVWDGWPRSWGAGILETFGATKTTSVAECYWFGGYAYAGHGGEGQTFGIGSDELQGSRFIDDAQPPHLEAIAAFGSLGFGASGDTPCPGDRPFGVCCQRDGSCTLTTEFDCDAPASWNDAAVSCAPNPCGPSDVDDAAGVALLGMQIAPTPFAGMVTLRLSVPAATTAEVSIYDAAGRLVRIAWQGALEAGASTLIWDGCDDVGRELPAGVYLVRMECAWGDAVGRLVKSR